MIIFCTKKERSHDDLSHKKVMIHQQKFCPIKGVTLAIYDNKI
jgi:hypothetical protein